MLISRQALAAVLLCASTLPAGAQSFPDRPIRLVVPYGTGGITDITARIVAPEMGDEPQTIINKRILEDADFLVGIFWTRLGTPTASYASGAVEEIEEHLAAGKPAMLYFSAAPAAMARKRCVICSADVSLGAARAPDAAARLKVRLR